MSHFNNSYSKERKVTIIGLDTKIASGSRDCVVIKAEVTCGYSDIHFTSR